MADKPWKNEERTVARMFGTERALTSCKAVVFWMYAGRNGIGVPKQP